MALGDQLRSIEQTLRSSVNLAADLKDAQSLLSKMDVSKMSGTDLLAYSQLVEMVNKLNKALKETGETGKKNLEQLRKSMESLTDRTKHLVEELAKAGGLTGGLARGMLQVGTAAATFAKEADVGRFIQQMTAGIPIVGAFGAVIGETVSAYVRSEDRLRILNKTLIDAYAATGRFGKGIEHVTSIAPKASESLTRYGQQVGIGSEQLEKFISGLSEAGFSMEQIGFDEKTGEIKSMTGSIEAMSESYGTLAATISMARMAGLSESEVISQMQMQMKTMGASVGESVDTFVALKYATDKTKLSSQIMLPILRQVQEQYALVGVNSENAMRAVGRFAAAGGPAGAGARAGVFARMMGSLAGAQFGTQAFMGQQMGMGRGLAAGFGFFQGAKDRPGDMAIGVGRVIRDLFGGKNITTEQAKTNEYLASMKLGQEQTVMQLFGLSQLEARNYMETLGEYEKIADEQGENSDAAKKKQEELAEITKTEKEYMGQTAKNAQKIALFLERMQAITGRLVVVVGRGFTAMIASFLRGVLGKLPAPLEEFFRNVTQGRGELDKILTGMGDAAETFVDKLLEGGETESFMQGFFSNLGDRFASVANLLKAGAKLFYDILAKVAPLLGIDLPALSAEYAPAPIAQMKQEARGASWAGISPALGNLNQLTADPNKFNVPGAGEKAGMQSFAKAGLAATAAIGGGVVRAGLTMGGEKLTATATGKILAKQIAGKVAIPLALIMTAKDIKDLWDARAAADKAEEDAIRSALDDASVHSRAIQQYLTTMTKQVELLNQIEGIKEEGTERIQEALTLTQSPEAMAALSAEQQQAYITLARNALAYRTQRITGGMQLPGGGGTLAGTLAAGELVSTLHAQRGVVENTQAQLAPAPPAQDAWSISRGGMLHVSSGDMVVNSLSLAKALHTGFPGEALRGLPQVTGTVAGPAAQGSVEQEVVIHLVGLENKLGQLFDTYLYINMEKGVIQAGKEGVGKLRHGTGGPTWG